MGTTLAAQTEPLCVVVGVGSHHAQFSLDELRMLFAGSKQSELIPLNHPARSKYRVLFDKAVLSMGPDQAADYWIERKRRRQPGPPRSVPSIATLRRVLARLPEAVGYLPPRQMTSQVRVVRVDGKYPEEQGYPLASSVGH